MKLCVSIRTFHQTWLLDSGQNNFEVIDVGQRLTVIDPDMNKKPVVPAWLPASWQLLYKYAEVKSVGNLTDDFLALHGFEFLLCNFELVWSQKERLGLCVWRLLWWSASPRDLAGMIGQDINSRKFLEDGCQDCSLRFRKRNSPGVHKWVVIFPW